MSQPRQPSLFSYTNQGLFSDYYLAHRVRERPEWAAADAPAVFEALRGLWQGFTPQGENEAQTEEFWIRPVLRALDHHFEVQPKVRMQGAARQPDYIFFPTEAARLAVPHGVVLADTDLAGALAVGDAKAWDLPLDRAVKGKPVEVSQNPSIQIDHYIRHTGRPWGILTNGRQWRLYHRDTSGKLDVFYAVDLPALLEQGDVEAFKSFYLFFRRAALIGQPAWLDLVLSESREYERGVSDRLRDQVYDALRELAQGFLDFPPNRLTPTPATLKLVYDSSLIVLYRLLFILYAESRGLLPVHANAAYTEYSLHTLKRRVARDLDLGHTAVPSIANDWHTLQGLWTVIDQGDPHLGVPAYNGGLFDPDQHPWLERHRVGDERLRRAIDLLARVQDAATGKRDFVDYRDLEVRHLGSIYEGLLEYSLRHAETALTVRKEKGREVYAPADTPAAARVQPGQVYLVTDKGERKATGSYYTPDYIVQYIVEHTVGPVLDRLRQAHPDDAALAEAILRVNVLDPAMGSGHFLVAVTDFIARYLVGLGLTTDGGLDSEGEPAYWRRRVAQSCVYGVDLNPLAVELAKLSLWLATVSQDRPLSFLDHHLRVGNSLVGARVADLGLGTEDDGRQTTDGGRQTADGSAVSGQRSVVKGARSVVGGRRSAEARARAAGQLTWLDDPQFVGQMRAATGFMQELEGLRGETLAEVAAQKRLWAQVSDSITRRYRTLADVWTARRFGLDLDDELFAGLTQHVLRGGFAVPRYQALLDEAERVAQAQRFFHWELEFPEVFFDEHGRLLADQSGFDAVVGNPPYVRQEQLSALKPYFQATFASFHGVADLYIYFYEQGLRLLQQSGRLSYISSGTFARTNFAVEFRKWLPTVAQLEQIIDFGENQPFEGAEMVRPSIVVLKKGRHEEAFRSLFLADKIPASLDQEVAEQGMISDPSALQQSEWTFQPSGNTQLFRKIVSVGRQLIDVVEGNMYRGAVTGLNEVFIIDATTRQNLIGIDDLSDLLLKPIVRGEDLRPWYQEDEGRWLVFTRRGIEIDRYKGVKSYLEQFRNRLEPKPLDWNGPGDWPGRKSGSYQWYEIQDSADYYKSFEQPKIFWPDIAKLPRFSYDEIGKYVNDKGYIIVSDDMALLGILQSRVIWFAISQICLPLRLRAGLWQYQMKAQFVSRLPIPDGPTADREAIGNLAMSITEAAKARYSLHRRARRRIQSDLGTPDKALNQKLTAWWDLDFPAFRAELQKVFKHDIPLKQRDEWEEWLAEQREQHTRLTADIVRLETALNARVYTLFDLTPAEIQVIEDSTKYKYGEV